jgi:hypothetical protein
MSEYPDGTSRPLLQFEMVRETYLIQHETPFREYASRVRLTTEIGRTQTPDAGEHPLSQPRNL